MTINLFKLEDYLGRHEFTAPHLLCCSDAQSWSLTDILSMATPDELDVWSNLSLGYTEVKGHPQLRQAIATNHYPGLSADQILCFAGAEDAIFCSLFALLEPQDHVIVITPCYQSLWEIARLKECSMTTIELQEEKGWRIDLEAIKKAITPKTKWLVMNFPHNPTGQIITQDELKELTALLDRCGIGLFSDEVYRLLGAKETQWSDPAAVHYSRAVSVGVMSKSYGLAGLRIGWIACQDKRLLSQIERMRHYTSICNSALSEVISLIALRNHQVLIERNNQIVHDNLQLLDLFMTKNKDLFSWVRPQGGCVGFVHYHGPDSVEDFCQRVRENVGVLLMPASIYDYPPTHFRIGFGRKNMPESLAVFEEFLKK